MTDRQAVEGAAERVGAEEHTPEHGSHLSWRTHPFRENWKRSSLVLLVLVIVWGFVYITSEGDIVLTGLSVVILIGTLSPYFFSSEYKLDDEFIVQKRGSLVQKKRWKEFRNYHIGKRYIQLSPFTYASRLESFRSMMLYVRPDNREQVLDLVRRHIDKPEDARQSTAVPVGTEERT